MVLQEQYLAGWEPWLGLKPPMRTGGAWLSVGGVEAPSGMVGGLEGPHQDCPRALRLLVTCVPIWPALLAAVETCAGSYGIGHFHHPAAARCAGGHDSGGTGTWCTWA